MRRLFGVSLVALLAGVGIVALIRTDPGYVLVSHGNYTLETSLWIGLVLLGAALLAFFYLLRLLYRLISGQRTFVNWLGNRRSNQAQRASTRGIISYVEGNWARARRQLERGAQNNESPLANYLLAARASDALGESERVTEFLQSAQDAEPAAAAAVEIVRAQTRLRAGEYREALAILDGYSSMAGKTPAILGLLQQAYEGMGDWDSVLGLLPDLRKHKLLSAQGLDELERRAHQHRRAAAATVSDLDTAWQALPSAAKPDATMLRIYIARLVALGENDAAEKSIVRALKKHWDPELVRQYGLIDNSDAAARLNQAERWLPEHPEDAQLLLALGRLCLRESLWGKARDYFESSYRAQPSAEVCAELGRLLLGLGEPKVAAAYYREGLAASADELPALPMPDKIVSNHHLLERQS